MRNLISIILIVLFPALLITSCEKSDKQVGTVGISITDAPIDASNVTGVNLTITGIQYHTSNGEWLTFKEFQNPVSVNILDLTNGISALLGNFEMEAGTYTQLRFMLDATEDGTSKQANPGCFIEFSDGTQEPLYVPSGSESGYKAVGAFTVPVNGNVEITADFDARKSIHVTSGQNKRYILKPTIRLAVNNQAGQIKGTVTNAATDTSIVIYAYAAGTYTTSEADTPVDETTARFPNAVTSSIADESYNYCLSFLAPMNYDLVITTSVNGEYQSVIGMIEGITVESKKASIQDIDISSL